MEGRQQKKGFSAATRGNCIHKGLKEQRSPEPVMTYTKGKQRKWKMCAAGEEWVSNEEGGREELRRGSFRRQLEDLEHPVRVSQAYTLFFSWWAGAAFWRRPHHRLAWCVLGNTGSGAGLRSKPSSTIRSCVTRAGYLTGLCHNLLKCRTRTRWQPPCRALGRAGRSFREEHTEESVAHSRYTTNASCYDLC